MDISINFGGDKSGVFFIVFLGLPIGSLLGFSIVDKALYKTRGWNIIGLGIGLTLSILGALIGIMLISALGVIAVVLVPVMIITFSLTGYQAGYMIVKTGTKQ